MSRVNCNDGKWCNDHKDMKWKYVLYDSFLQYRPEKHNKNPLYRFPFRTVDFQLIPSIGSCLLYLIYYLCKTILWIVFSDFIYLPIGLYLVSLKLLEFRLSFWWSVLLFFILLSFFWCNYNNSQNEKCQQEIW